ncbi:ISAs1 family transposase [Vibrio chaetopteri]|uniref:ISAs1 family transposase n=1 Tax=Vibrio chaetopteri TaxID=3016528 RepID=UPI003AB8903E
MSSQHPFMHFDVIPDYRQQGKVEHKLTDIILLTICAVLSGQDDWKAISLYGEARLDFLKRFGDFSHGVPSTSTIARAMGMISATRLQKCFIEWMKDCCELTKGEVIAIDGKTVKGSYDDSRGLGAIHMVNAFATENGVSLGQHKVYEKSNEITAIPELLELLDISGCLVTIDAMGCQKKIAQKILNKNADYLLAVKGNQKRLEEAISEIFNSRTINTFGGDKYVTQENGHGRTETRVSMVEHNTDFLGDLAFNWSNLSTVGVVFSIRQEDDKLPETVQVKYYISSASLSAKALLESTRAHWSIENQMHWRLDVGFNEDACRIRREQAGENFAVVRHIALNLLTAEKSFNGGIKRKQKKANRSNAYLSQVLAGHGAS